MSGTGQRPPERRGGSLCAAVRGGRLCPDAEADCGSDSAIGTQTRRIAAPGRTLGEILLYLGLGLLVCLPWMVRTVVISGWLLYPFPALDLFSVDWKMPAGPIALDAAQIKTWGRALNNAALVDMPMREWFPGWFAALSGMEKLLILGDLACIPLFMGYALLSLLKRKKRIWTFCWCWPP